jgi:hypothetical protein
MKALRIAGIALLIYAGIVVVFESLLGYVQPSGERTLVITTFDASEQPFPRVVSRVESGGQLYVAANHWPRAWYRRALARPEVRVTLDGADTDYRAVPVPDDESARVNAGNRLPLVFRFLTGFPPRRFLRLDPR